MVFATRFESECVFVVEPSVAISKNPEQPEPWQRSSLYPASPAPPESVEVDQLTLSWVEEAALTESDGTEGAIVSAGVVALAAGE